MLLSEPYFSEFEQLVPWAHLKFWRDYDVIRGSSAARGGRRVVGFPRRARLVAVAAALPDLCRTRGALGECMCIISPPTTLPHVTAHQLNSGHSHFYQSMFSQHTGTPYVGDQPLLDLRLLSAQTPKKSVDGHRIGIQSTSADVCFSVAVKCTLPAESCKVQRLPHFSVIFSSTRYSLHAAVDVEESLDLGMEALMCICSRQTYERDEKNYRNTILCHCLLR